MDLEGASGAAIQFSQRSRRKSDNGYPTPFARFISVSAESGTYTESESLHLREPLSPLTLVLTPNTRRPK